ncbi:MAG: hypothetical protein M3410_05390 [Acidobacteriota bacterium]|nr:hypothetical protein [Acidobacteriota bacterium]
MLKMKSSGTHLRISYRVVKLALLCLVIYVPALRAQEPAAQLTAPPPLKIVSREERARIDAADDSKARIRATLQLAELRLAKAEVLTNEHDFDGATGELGQYEALMDDALGYLSPMMRDKNKTRDLYKRLELALRAHGPRLTAIRRGTPLEYAIWIKKLEEFARQGRTEALNSFYGHTVFRDPQKKTEEKPLDKPTNNSPAAPERRP